MLSNKKTYEILTPESVGVRVNNIVLGKHSGRHAFEERLHELGLAAPDTVELLYRLRRDGVDVPLENLTVDECADTICRAFGEAEGK